MSTKSSRSVIGVTGRPWRADVRPWGRIEPWGGGRTLDWYVAAEDRWHVPGREPSVRQRRILGTPVLETRLAVPRGDVVHRTFAAAEAGGVTVVELANESASSVAVAIDRGDILTERPLADVPVRGIELPDDAIVLPLAHGATVRVALAHDGRSGPELPPTVPSAETVASGWRRVVDRASRLELPPGALGSATAELVVARRCDVLLGEMARADDDAVEFTIGLGELVRLGEDPEPWLPELATGVESLGPIRGWMADAALRAARRVLVAADESRARRDLDTIVRRRGAVSSPPDSVPEGVAVVPWLEERLVTADGRLLPHGFPPAWLGSSIEAHGLPLGDASHVSFAVRWHGARPAVLWEISGDPVVLTAPVADPAWRTDQRSGEALWAAPAAETATSFG